MNIEFSKTIIIINNVAVAQSGSGFESEIFAQRTSYSPVRENSQLI